MQDGRYDGSIDAVQMRWRFVEVGYGVLLPSNDSDSDGGDNDDGRGMGGSSCRWIVVAVAASGFVCRL